MHSPWQSDVRRSCGQTIELCVERTRAVRSGIYDVSVRIADGTLIAEFRGHSRTIEGTLLRAVNADNGK